MKIIKYMMQVLVVGSLLTSCVEDADVTAYLTEDQLSNVAQDDPDKTFSAAVAGMYSDMQKYYDTDMQHNYFGQKSFDYLTSATELYSDQQSLERILSCHSQCQ